MRQTTKATVAKARALRRTMSRPEARLWQVLRTRPGGFKFRRQHPAGPYIIDFYCPQQSWASKWMGSATVWERIRSETRTGIYGFRRMEYGYLDFRPVSVWGH